MSEYTPLLAAGADGVLLALFVLLKLTGAVAWSWWWVLAPLWIAALVVLAGITFAFAFLAALTALDT